MPHVQRFKEELAEAIEFSDMFYRESHRMYNKGLRLSAEGYMSASVSWKKKANKLIKMIDELEKAA